MAETRAGVDLAGFEAQLGEAAAALQSFAGGPAQRAAEQVSQSFERAGGRIASALSRAAAGGENAFKQLAKVIIEELAKIALERVFAQGGAKPAFFGARAAGGNVNAGGAYLVGERGPEMFIPRQGGAIAAAPTGAVNVHFHLNGSSGAGEIARHQGQIAAAVARAVAYGRRNL